MTHRVWSSINATLRASLIEDIEASVRHRFDGRDVTRVLDAWKRMSDGHVRGDCEHVRGVDTKSSLF